MKNEKEIRDQIENFTKMLEHVLDRYPASFAVNGPVAIMQTLTTSRLDALYWTLGEKRPRYKVDDSSKIDH